MIGDYLAQEVWRQARSGVDANGQPTFTSAVKTRGRWLEKRRLVRDAQGEQVISEVTITLNAAEPVTVGDRLSNDETTWLTVIAVSVARTLSGAALLQRAYL